MAAQSKTLTALAARKAEPRDKPYKLAAGGGLYPATARFAISGNSIDGET